MIIRYDPWVKCVCLHLQTFFANRKRVGCMAYGLQFDISDLQRICQKSTLHWPLTYIKYVLSMLSVQGLLSAAHHGANTNSGHFSIIMAPAHHLDGKVRSDAVERCWYSARSWQCECHDLTFSIPTVPGDMRRCTHPVVKPGAMIPMPAQEPRNNCKCQLQYARTRHDQQTTHKHENLNLMPPDKIA